MKHTLHNDEHYTSMYLEEIVGISWRVIFRHCAVIDHPDLVAAILLCMGIDYITTSSSLNILIYIEGILHCIVYISTNKVINALYSERDLLNTNVSPYNNSDKNN